MENTLLLVERKCKKIEPSRRTGVGAIDWHTFAQVLSFHDGTPITQRSLRMKK